MSITHYHAVMIDETGCEFGASVSAFTRDEAREKLRDEYPESRIAAGGDWDDEGRPIFHQPPEDDEPDEYDDEDWSEYDDEFDLTDDES